MEMGENAWLADCETALGKSLGEAADVGKLNINDAGDRFLNIAY